MSLILLTTLFMIQNRVMLACTATRAHCCLMFSWLLTNTPRSFSSIQFFSLKPVAFHMLVVNKVQDMVLLQLIQLASAHRSSSSGGIKDFVTEEYILLESIKFKLEFLTGKLYCIISHLLFTFYKSYPETQYIFVPRSIWKRNKKAFGRMQVVQWH